MLKMLVVLLNILCLIQQNNAGPVSCCSRKTVGGVAYTLVKEGDTSSYGCMESCIYSKDGLPGSMFCFEAGVMEAKCIKEGGKEITIPWFGGMDPLDVCVETGTQVIFNITGSSLHGHNVVQMETQSDYDACTGFLGQDPTVAIQFNTSVEFDWKADTDGTFYFACGVGTHCSAWGMKAKITVAPSCQNSITIPWTYGMEKQEICVEKGTTVNFDWTGSNHNVVQLATHSDYVDCTGITDTIGNSDSPYVFEAETLGKFHFACGVGLHCKDGNMKAMITVSDECE